jgi:hypothetical protein
LVHLLQQHFDVFNEIIRIDRGKYSEGFLYFVLCGLVKTRHDTRKCLELRETEILRIKLTRWNGVVIEKTSQCERAAAVIGERADFLGEGFLIIYGLVDVVEYLGLCDFFECDIATLGEREAAAFYLILHALSRRFHERSISLLKTEFLVLTADKIKDSEAVLAREEAKPAPELLQEHSEGFGRTQEENGIHFRDIDAFDRDVDSDTVLTYIPIFVTSHTNSLSSFFRWEWASVKRKKSHYSISRPPAHFFFPYTE